MSYAAGLSISEIMRWQIRGLDKEKQNIQDGMSLIDTADGALQETQCFTEGKGAYYTGL